MNTHPNTHPEAPRGGKVARPARFERAAYGLEVRCSIQLSYGRTAMILGYLGLMLQIELSNWRFDPLQRPPGKLCRALPASMTAPAACSLLDPTRALPSQQIVQPRKDKPGDGAIDQRVERPHDNAAE